MFLISDTRQARTQKIIEFTQKEIVIPVLLAAADFEWSCRRAILALGSSPTSDLKGEDGALYKCSSLPSYAKAWNREVYPLTGRRLSDIIPDWEAFKGDAFPLRHKLIHGEIGTTGHSYALKRVRQILAASEALARFAEEQGSPIFGKRIVRRKLRTSL